MKFFSYEAALPAKQAPSAKRKCRKATTCTSPGMVQPWNAIAMWNIVNRQMDSWDVDLLNLNFE